MKIILNFRISMLQFGRLWVQIASDVHSDVTWRPRYWVFDYLKTVCIYIVYHWLLSWIQLVVLHTQAESSVLPMDRAYKSVGHQLHSDLDDDSGSRSCFTTAAHVDGSRTNERWSSHHQNSYDIWPPLTGRSFVDKTFSIAPRLFNNVRLIKIKCFTCFWLRNLF